MANQGPLSPGTLVNTNNGAPIAWTNPSNAASSNDSYATAVDLDQQPSQQLWVTNFGFTVTGGATIDGVLVEIERSVSGAGNVTDDGLHLLRAGVEVGSDKKDVVTSWPGSDTIASYGGASDLWGTTWTDTQINASTFGVSLAAQETGVDLATAQVDHIRITVYYSAGGAAGPVSQSRFVRQAVNRAGTY